MHMPGRVGTLLPPIRRGPDAVWRGYHALGETSVSGRGVVFRLGLDEFCNVKIPSAL